ncbi:HWE histidine kinase domain-containing protein [Methylobacterium sp. NEAU 140]|uniref:sensor histidine kinase n=1 Tax=Methylobacterium sp. NEAU 140 TaxID=3064945 RepID=UPI0027338D0D|nr:HWE histidine kinase domain-containing protein [Methylobacterium sp. NEAU 140]MDP4024994.1 HWE histidine kinase domain-containing protein [Methylobacterium sp. NEAU 140]
MVPARRSWLSRRLHRFGRNGFSTQVYLIALVVALIGPGLIFTGILLMRYASAERARFEQDARENVRGIGLSLDRDTAGLVSVLQTLATSPRIRDGDFAAFDAQARLVRESIDLDVLLRRPDGQEMVNTGVPRGAPLPLVPLPFDHDLAKGTQRAMVSGFVPGPTPDQASYAVGVPVMMDGEVAYILSFTVPLSRLQGILAREVVQGWTTGISDRNGTVLARLPDPGAVVGRPRLATLRQTQTGTPGVWEGQDRQHRPVVVIEARSRLTGWTVGTSIPQVLVDARVRRWVWAFAGFGLLVLATSSVLAVNLWSRVSRPLRILAASGPALARGEAIPRVPSPVHEIQRLGAVLAEASQRLRTREEERDRALEETRRGLSALSESEARFRHMADSAPALIWMTDDAGEVSFANLHFEHLFGMPAAELADEGWHRIVHPDDLEAFRVTFQEAFDARAPFRTEVRVIDRTGAVRWLRCEGVPRLDDAGRFLGYTGCNVDITDAKFAEEHLLLLIHELNHRVKNTLATVQSIAGQSLRGLEGPEADAARAAFEARLLALARVHDVLTRESWDGAELSAVVADAIRPLESTDGSPSRFRVVGPALRLPPRLALSIAMALHELGTNAVKYGALSAEGGQVGIAWTVRREGETRLTLRWTESGGPPVQKPTRTGFGSRLIERSLARELAGEVTLSYEPAGVVCTIDAPVPPPGLMERKSAVAPARIAPLPLAG